MTFLLTAVLLVASHQRRAANELTVLPLDGGLSIHARPRGASRALLVDCGNTNTFDSVLKPFLHARGERRLRSLILTHGDLRHMGAATAVTVEFRPEHLGTSDVRFRSAPYRRLTEQELPGLATRVPLNAGAELDGWTVLHPPAGLRVSRADEAAMVLRGYLGHSRVLLLSDLDRTGQRRLLDRVPASALNAEIVITGLPGEGEPLIDDLLRVIAPRLIVVGDDEWPPTRRASGATLQRLETSGATVLSTRRTGAVTLVGGGLRWRALDAQGRVLADDRPSATPSAQPVTE